MRAGNWKRKCSVALAVCLVFGGLTLPGGTIKARASENQTVAEEYQYSEEAVSGNNSAADDSNAAQTVSYALSQEYNKVVLSYSVASKTTGGVMYLPTVANGGTRLAELEHPQPRNSKAVNGVDLNLYRKNSGYHLEPSQYQLRTCRCPE